MADSEPIHDNPRNTRNLPAVVPEGEAGRSTTENWLLRAIRTLFGWKAGSVRDDLQVVLDASQPDEVGFSAVERTMLQIARSVVVLPAPLAPSSVVSDPSLSEKDSP